MSDVRIEAIRIIEKIKEEYKGINSIIYRANLIMEQLIYDEVDAAIERLGNLIDSLRPVEIEREAQKQLFAQIK